MSERSLTTPAENCKLRNSLPENGSSGAEAPPAERSVALPARSDGDSAEPGASVPEGARTAKLPGGLRLASTGADLLAQGDVHTRNARRESLHKAVENLSAPERESRARHLELLGVAHNIARAQEWSDYLAAGDFSDKFDPETGELEEAPAKPDPVSFRDENGEAHDATKWHVARANGQRFKWERIDGCAESQNFIQATCSSTCGNDKKLLPIGCGHRECPKCRGLQANQIKKALEGAREALSNEASRLKVEKIITEKLLTVTAPHYGDGEVILYKGKRSKALKVKRRRQVPAQRRRIAVIYEAWRLFQPWLFEHITRKCSELEKPSRPDGGASLCHMARFFEWTEGEEKGERHGHPHFHIWLHGAFIDQGLAHTQWNECLELASGEKRDTIRPDVRAVKGNGYLKGKGGKVDRDRNGRKKRIVDELIKYMVKDLKNGTGNGDQFVSPRLLATVHSELVGRRRRQTSARFRYWVDLAKAYRKKQTCPYCEHVVEFHHVHTHGEHVELEAQQKPPPDQVAA